MCSFNNQIRGREPVEKERDKMPNHDLCQFYFVVTSNHTWGRSLELKDALKSAMANSKSKYILYVGVCKEGTTPEEVKNIMNCFNVNDFGGLKMYSNPSAEDVTMFERCFLGWLTDESSLK
jgi:hypothetical protein